MKIGEHEKQKPTQGGLRQGFQRCAALHQFPYLTRRHRQVSGPECLSCASFSFQTVHQTSEHSGYRDAEDAVLCDETCRCGHFGGRLDLWNAQRSHRGHDLDCLNESCASTRGAPDQRMQELQEDNLGREQYMPAQSAEVAVADMAGYSHCSLEWHAPHSARNLNAARENQNRFCDHLGHFQHTRHARLCLSRQSTVSWTHSTAEQNNPLWVRCKLACMLVAGSLHGTHWAGRPQVAAEDNCSVERSWDDSCSGAKARSFEEQDYHSNSHSGVGGHTMPHCEKHSLAGGSHYMVFHIRLFQDSANNHHDLFLRYCPECYHLGVQVDMPADHMYSRQPVPQMAGAEEPHTGIVQPSCVSV